MAVISATRTRKRILATLLAPPRGPFRDPPPVTTHSFPFSSLGPSIRPLRVYAFSTLVPLFLYLSLSLFLSSCPSPLVFFLLAIRATPRASVYYLYNAWPGGAPALCSCTHKPLLLRSSGTRREYGE